MITDEEIAIQRCVRMIKEGKVTSINGKELDIKGDTLCVHGDGPKALAFVKKIREKFTEDGIVIRHLSAGLKKQNHRLRAGPRGQKQETCQINQ